MFLEISQNSLENACAKVSFLIKLQKKTVAQEFSCEFCEISKNTFFIEHLRTTASAYLFWKVALFGNAVHIFYLKLQNESF